METVVVTAIGSFSANIVTKKCRESGIQVIGCDVYPRGRIADTRNVEALCQVPYTTNTDYYTGTMMPLCRGEGAETVIPLMNAETNVFNLHRDRFSEIDVTLCMSDKACIGLCRDKVKLCRYLEGHMGGTVILALRPGGVGPDKIRYPTACKPYNGRSNQDLKMVESHHEVGEILGEMNPADYIVQPMIKGDVVTVDVVRSPEQGTYAAICRRGLLRTPDEAETSVLVFRSRQLGEHYQVIVGLLGIKGYVNVEFTEDRSGVYHMLECNPRLSGDVEFFCLAGYDCVTNHLRCLEGKETECDGSVTGVYIARKYGEYIIRAEQQGGVTGYKRQSVR